MKIQRTMVIDTLEEMCELMCGGVEDELSEAFNGFDDVQTSKLSQNDSESLLEPPRGVREGNMRGGGSK